MTPSQPKSGEMSDSKADSKAVHKYSRCPDCGRKSVYFVARPHGQDDYECRYRDCDFFFYTRSGAAVDAKNEQRWKDAQSVPSEGPSTQSETKGGHSSQHTPGPWEVEKLKNASGWTYRIGSAAMREADSPIEVYDFCFTPQHLPDGECEANVSLIAAAPDLLAAAQCAANVLFLLQDEVKALGCNAKNVPEKLRAAIAIATKETT